MAFGAWGGSRRREKAARRAVRGGRAEGSRAIPGAGGGASGGEERGQRAVALGGGGLVHGRAVRRGHGWRYGGRLVRRGLGIRLGVAGLRRVVRVVAGSGGGRRRLLVGIPGGIVAEGFRTLALGWLFPFPIRSSSSWRPSRISSSRLRVESR